ncbi:aromatic amino acid transaminase [Alteromonas sp. AMM-1]|uniref:amino acid aminotransferase n=1 Tax=Alteromonas sp. AMM-1 TaxID=3394233 RepID=UPI0039A61C0C
MLCPYPSATAQADGKQGLMMFESVNAYAGDPILSLMDTYMQDTRDDKVNLTIGFYYDENGIVPDMAAVKQAKARLFAEPPASPTYLPMDGLPEYRTRVQTLAFGDALADVQARTATVQSLGGSGALKVGADFIKRYFPQSQVWVSNPTWENHHAIFKGAGFAVNTYRYYSAETKELDFAGMLEDLNQLPARSVVLLHPCCHNPTGIDLTAQQWQQVIGVIAERELLPFFDMAYQGFGQGLQTDTLAIALMAKTGLPFLLSHSFSKIFSLYSERVGALSVVCENPAIAHNVQGQLKFTVRSNYSTPPAHGARLVNLVLSDAGLTQQWQQELTDMRNRMQAMRSGLVKQLSEHRPDRDFGYLQRQQGMFSYSGLTPQQVARLKDEFGVYMISSGRVCIAGLNNTNLERTAIAIAAVL